MKILVIGQGAREHAICVSLRNSRNVTQLWCTPGNPGIKEVATVLPYAVTDLESIKDFVLKEGIDLTVVGPEAALEVGIVDLLQSHQRAVVGPLKAAALIESSKAFAKQVMVEAQVPTAGYEVFTERDALTKYCKDRGAPLVLKLDGLAAGKGVVVVTEDSQMSAAIEQLWDDEKDCKIVVEDFLEGVEVSCIFASNGEVVVPLLQAHDYKRIGDGDSGPNTGGMGSVCPSERISQKELEWIARQVAQPVIDTMKRRGTPFAGFLYAGMMVPALNSVTDSERTTRFKVLEFNARLGDPECQAILSRLASDPLDLFKWIANLQTELPELLWREGFTTCVVIASDGYPEASKSGDVISGLELASMIPNLQILHASTSRREDKKVVSNGGRTLSLVGVGSSLAESRRTAYKGVDMIQLRGARIRRDIGAE